MEAEEIIATMDKPKSMSRVAQYRVIYQQATGKPWKGCFCGNGFNNFFNVCKNYANALRLQINKTNVQTK